MSAEVHPVKKVSGSIRREQIVRAVFSIAGKKGMGNVTTSAIAKKAGMSEANLYRHLQNKDEIYIVAFEFIRDRIRENMENAIQKKKPLTMLKQFFKLQLVFMEKNPGISRFMFSQELHVSKNLRANVLATMYGFSKKLASFIRKGQVEKKIRQDINSRTTALLFVGMIQGLAFRWSLSGFSFSLVQEGMKVWSQFEKTIVSCDSQ
ncbi:MAG: TetR/AcrR family transcriptional regulator [Nitrospirota bacterium]